MSQITRCPSCSTSFKVVADQLRISHGWVRCGQCKEVFDASAHLLPAAPPALLPDVSLTDVRPPTMPVPRKAEVGRSWGEPEPLPPSPPVAPAARAHASALADTAFSPFSTEHTEAVAESADVHTSASVLDVPQPAVPAFLSVTGAAVPEGDAGPGPLLPFTWRPDPVRSASAVDADGTVGSVDAEALRLAPKVSAEPASGKPSPLRSPLAERVRAPAPSDAHATAVGGVPPGPLGGYELPAAAPPDSEEVVADLAPPAALTPMGYPALELPPKPAARQEESTDTVAGERAEEPQPLADLAPKTATQKSKTEALALEEDRSPAAVLQAPARKRVSPRTSSDAVREEEGPEAEQEVSFVVAARRKAFWRKPLVRAVLGVLLLVSVVGLGLQVAVQERDRLAAMDARVKPWLAALCAPLHCEIAPPRQIAHVVIDSSSFSKARGDSYQLALTMKSKASTALAMPAVELTLTDAQDQPVLRRVLLPADMGAPMELPAAGEWSASMSVIVTTGGARVAGYRLLAFYP